MSNNPGKKGKPTPWQKKAAEHRQRALEEFRLAKRPDYAAWSKRRSEAAFEFRQQTGADSFSTDFASAMKASDKLLRAWDKVNPSPLSWDEGKVLKEEFAAQYVSVDHS